MHHHQLHLLYTKMALRGQLKDAVVIGAPADKVYEFYTRKPYEMKKSSPGKILGVDLTEGQWGKDGSVYCWNCVLDGKTVYLKGKVGIDDINKSASHKEVEGHLMNSFKSFIISIQVIPNLEKGCSVLWTFDYEKVNVNVEDPTSLLQFVVDCCKDVGVYLNPMAPQLQTN
ncbi:MLP-like protein 43 [Mangifera indica]|uniref:MLP-like protein 43 n=1 Tax=Mangifera indica TaxID=29780 RepID=UPI001CF95E08|nr:MLP-like protein 43 [Mangifera indica]